MSYSGKFKDKNNNLHPVTSVLYGTCDTAAATVAKVVTCTDFDALMTGVTIRVKFANANTAESPTVNINSTGAKSIYRFGSTAPVDGNSWNAGEVVELVYDGTSFFMTGADDIAAKQNATDNSLDTEAKTIVGAINENVGDIGSLKSGFTNLSEEVNGSATTYPYADVITINDAVPANLAECNVKIEPVQSGSGVPSPTNIRPITGHTEVDVQRDGKNVLDMSTFKRIIMNDGSASNNWITFDQKIPINGKNAFYFSSSANKSIYRFVINLYDANKNILAQKYKEYVNVSGFSFTIDNASAEYFKCGFYNATSIADVSFTDAQIEAGTAKTPYEPYQGKTYTIALGDTIYGGKVRIDSNGNTVMDVDRASVDMGTLTYYYDDIYHRFATNSLTNIKQTTQRTLPMVCECYDVIDDGREFTNVPPFAIYNGNDVVTVYIHDSRYTSTSDLATALDGMDLVYPIAQPFTVQLTPEQIQLLQGTNTLYASTGDISVTVNGVSGAIGAVQEQVNGLAEDVAEITDEVADIAELSKQDLIAVELNGSDGRYYSTTFTHPYYLNRMMFLILRGNQNGSMTLSPVMYLTNYSSTASISTADSNITSDLNDGVLTITVDAGTSAWVKPVMFIRRNDYDWLK